ncbi:hypothetical protein IE53DRAFT_78350 [Violaceomyces palustris]|uniref:Uncharacterized protein n=1 Tax=Violaceomyces palustris TaxID=1673888 RepID=A0ACD0NYA9_9BASI|nr:hypothetical protein IE53DRAFT_78350 [Violaceomyces palustris]
MRDQRGFHICELTIHSPRLATTFDQDRNRIDEGCNNHAVRVTGTVWLSLKLSKVRLHHVMLCSIDQPTGLEAEAEARERGTQGNCLRITPASQRKKKGSKASPATSTTRSLTPLLPHHHSQLDSFPPNPKKNHSGPNSLIVWEIQRRIEHPHRHRRGPRLENWSGQKAFARQSHDDVLEPYLRA